MAAGHVRRRGKRSWELKYDIDADPQTGQRRIRYASVKGTKRDAEAELVRLMAKANRGDHVDASKATLGEFLDPHAVAEDRPGPDAVAHALDDLARKAQPVLEAAAVGVAALVAERRDELLDQIAKLEEQKESGAIAEKKYKQDLKDLKFHLSKILERMGTKV